MKTNELSPAYLAAIESSNVAQRKYEIARNAYRARTIGDAEFLAARKEYAEAQAAFDVAYAKESGS
jgi:hypothetical protein